MFPQRPHPGETQEDILEAQSKFHGRKRSKFAESRGNAPSSPKKTEEEGPSGVLPTMLRPVVLERKPSDALPASPLSDDSNDPFPPVFKAPDKVLQGGNEKGKSIFAQTLGKKFRSTPIAPDNPLVDPSQRKDFGETSALFGESNVFNTSILQDIHEENVAKLSAMSEEDILAEQKSILTTLDPQIMNFLKRKSDKSKPEEESSSLEEENEKKSQKKMDEDRLEEEKRKWMKDITIPGESSADKTPLGLPARFDFKGDIMEGSQDDDFDSGLHHHGDEPHRAGYTLDELLTLARSTFPQQKVLALETLGAVVRNYKGGSFDGVFEVNILDSLLKSGILEILRLGMDEKSENVIFPSAQTLSDFLHNELDELALDMTFNHYMGYIQPSLPTEVSIIGSQSHAEYEEEKRELKDGEIIQLDVVNALLRMDILDRISYIITHLHPGVALTIACLKILLRIVRHSQVSARAVLHHPRLLKEIAKSFLPSLVKSYSLNPGDARGSPIHLALKLIRVLISWDKNYASTVLSTHKSVGESLLSYIAYDPTTALLDSSSQRIPTHEGLSLVLEAFRFWQILLRYKLGTQYYLDFYPILLRQLLYYENKVDVLDKCSIKKYVYDHGSALIQVLNAAVLNLGFVSNLDWSHFKEIFSLLENCVKKWSAQVGGSLDWSDSRPSSKVSIVNLLASGMRALADFYWKFSEQKDCCLLDLLEKHVRKYSNETLSALCGSPLFKTLVLASSVKSSAMNLTSEVNVESGKKRDPKNLPSFGSVVYRGSVVPSIGEGSPYNLLASAFYSLLLCKELDKSLPAPSSLVSTLGGEYEVCLRNQILGKKPKINSNWFTRIETHYWSHLALVLAKFRVESSSSYLLPLSHLALTFLHSWDEELAKELLTKVIFNEDLTCEMRKLSLKEEEPNFSSSLRDLEALYVKLLLPSKSLLERSKAVFSSGGVVNLTVSNGGELLLPWDWRFLPLLKIHNSRPSTDTPASEKEVSDVRLCLEWIVEEGVIKDHYPSVYFTRLCTVFTAAPDLFLDRRIEDSCRTLYRRLLCGWEDLDLSGGDNFFTFYSELLKQFSAVSYGNDLFAEFVTLPLAMKFGSKYRFAFWSDHMDDLRVVGLKRHSLDLLAFLHPCESDVNVLRVYFTSLLEKRVTPERNPFLYGVALHHVRSIGDVSLIQEFRGKLSSDAPLYKEMYLHSC